MHDGMPYNPIQGQGHGASEVPKIAFLKVYLRHYYGVWFNLQIVQFDRAGFLIFVLVFVSRDLELGSVPAVSPSTKKFF